MHEMEQSRVEKESWPLALDLPYRVYPPLLFSIASFLLSYILYLFVVRGFLYCVAVF
jgi:hypothetical protein